MKTINIISILSISVLLMACAKPQPDPVPSCPSVPVQILNISDNVVIGEVPPKPTPKNLMRITSRDRADVALGKVLTYTNDLKVHDDEVTSIAEICIGQIADRNKRLRAIKEYLILSQ